MTGAANGQLGDYELIATDRSWGRYLCVEQTRLVDRATELITGPGTMLDIGCETGRWAAGFHEKDWSVWGTEVREIQLQEAERRLPEAQLVLVDPDRTDLPVPDDELDIVVCMEVAPVINAPWFPAEVKRVLRPGGVLVGTFWNRSSWRGLVATAVTRTGRDWYAHDYRRWRAEMGVLGLTMVEEIGLCWAPFARGSDSRLVDVGVSIERKLGLTKNTRWSPWIGFVAHLEQ